MWVNQLEDGRLYSCSLDKTIKVRHPSVILLPHSQLPPLALSLFLALFCFSSISVSSPPIS